MPTEALTLAVISSSEYARQTYWAPRSQWWIRPCRLRLAPVLNSACSRASSGNPCVFRLVETAQPTILRECTSVMNATQQNPPRIRT